MYIHGSQLFWKNHPEKPPDLWDFVNNWNKRFFDSDFSNTQTQWFFGFEFFSKTQNQWFFDSEFS